MKWILPITIACLALLAKGPPRRVKAQVNPTPPCRAGTLDLRAGLISGDVNSFLSLNTGENNLFLCTPGSGIPPCQPTDANAFIIVGSLGLDNLGGNFWGLDGSSNKIDPNNESTDGAHHWNANLGTSQQNASGITVSLPVVSFSGMIPSFVTDCGSTLAVTRHKGANPQSVTADTTGCEQSFWTAMNEEHAGLYQASYDTAMEFVERCPFDRFAPAAFGVMAGDMQQGGNGPYPDGSISFGHWLLSALAWNSSNPTYFCADVESLSALFANSDTGWTALNTATNKNLSILYWIIHNPLCANTDDSESYYEGRGSQYETYLNYPGLDRDTVPFDTTIYTMQELGLDSVLKYAALLGVNESNAPSIITNAIAYPNPTGEGTVVSFGISREAYVTIALFDILGHQITSPSFGGVVETGNLSVPLTLQGLPSGTYFARIMTTFGEVQTVKIVKE